jgi:CDP-paratose 2-epimerase
MKYLITGGCGFLGTNIAVEILRQRKKIMLLDNMSRYGSIENLQWLRNQGDLIFRHGDVRSREDCQKAVADFKPDVVFHLAGQVAMTTSLADPRKDFEINVLGTLNVLEAIRSSYPDASLIYSSTNKVYGDLEHLKYEDTVTRYVLSDHPNGIGEDVGLNFHSPYGCSKGAADQYVLDYARMYGMKTAVFRHSSMYGGRQFSTSDQGWIGWFVEKAIEQSQGLTSEFTISGSGKQVRDLLHADDMVSLYLKASQRMDTISSQAFNIGGGSENSMSIIELINLLQDTLNFKLKYRKTPQRKSDQNVFIADIRKVEKMLDWTPKVGKTEGIIRMIDWVRSMRGENEQC